MIKQVGVVLLNYNDHGATVECLASIEGQGRISSIVVVDNASEEADRSALRAHLAERSDVQLVMSCTNGGFGFGMNLGIERSLAAGSDAVLLLNNDTRLIPGAVEALAAALDSDAIAGVAVPIVTTGSGDKISSAGGYIDAKLRARHHQVGISAARFVTPPNGGLTFAPGAALLVRRGVFADVGGFVEGYFLYCEDVEFSLRLCEAGWEITLAPKAVIWHAVQGGDQRRSTQSVYFRTRNAMWLARVRLRGVPRVRACVNAVLVGLRVVGPVSALHPRLVFAGLHQWVLGVRDGARRLPTGTDLTPRMFSD